jgi:5-methylthioribose kinase
MLNHLLLKTIHRPEAGEGYARCAAAFWDAYLAGTPAALAPAPSYVLGHVGCLMLARVDGKSPAEYLTPGERETARAAGRSLLLGPPVSVDAAWDLLAEALPR